MHMRYAHGNDDEDKDNEDTKSFVELKGGLKEPRQEETAIYLP